MSIGTKIIVCDDNGKPHDAIITGIRKLLGPFRLYEVEIEDSGQILELSPEAFKRKI